MRRSAGWARVLAWASSGLFALSCVPARASLQLCNQTSYVLDAATAIQQADYVMTRGWTRVFPGDCATAIAEPLKAPAYFVYARATPSATADTRSWGGQFQFCVEPKDFTLRERVSASHCEGALEAPFAPVGVSGAATWTMTFTESAGLDSPDKARAAGYRRLLDTIGYNPGDGDKALGATLAKFRGHAKLPSSVAADGLFAALESEAVKIEAPQGYSICNDGNSAIWAALGTKSGGDVESRGWWEVQSGKCLSPIETGLGRDPVYLFVSREGKAKLVGGPEHLCITNRQFEIRKQDHCRSRGYLVAGFLATNLQGSPGFVAHVGNDGLVGGQAGTPK